MKTKGLLVIALCLLLAGLAFAQTTLTRRLTTNVPFDFVVNGTAMPKGEYFVSDDGRKLMIQSKNESKNTVFVLNNDVAVSRPLDDGKLIFILTNGKHVLHQIALQGDDHINDILHEGNDEIELVVLQQSLK